MHARDPGDYPSLSPEEVARLLGLHTETIRRMARGGKLRAFRIAGRVKFTPNDVDRLAFAEPIVPLEREEPRPRVRRASPSPSGRGSVSRLDQIEREAQGE